jgi:hypothetical protein
MRHEISTDKHFLTLLIDDEERDLLVERKEEDEFFGSTNSEIEALEGLIANSELDWVCPEQTGDLTDAPLLGICGSEEYLFEDLPKDRVGEINTSRVNGVTWWTPILFRWGYEPYQVRSFLDDLINNKKTVFIDRW